MIRGPYTRPPHAEDGMSTPEKVTEEMRRLIAANREGKLTSDQWLAAVFEPLTPILVLLTPLIIVLAARAGRAGILVGLAVGVFATVWLGVTRMARYARLPLNYDVMVAAKDFKPNRLYGPPSFSDEGEQPYIFKRRYTPRFVLQKGVRYGVYWMHDGNAPVLLSVSPKDHPNAASWKPTTDFVTRRDRRRRKKLK
ncbi:MAG: hypothetical protein IPK52_03765 [Chloroflexi bacterium]|nr:hypothetical protein [Chloroflexota bacterium]